MKKPVSRTGRATTLIENCTFSSVSDPARMAALTAMADAACANAEALKVIAEKIGSDSPMLSIVQAKD